MKAEFKISILLNLVLSVGLVILAKKQIGHGDFVSLANNQPMPQPMPVSNSTNRIEFALKYFRWNQLESTNGYQVYVNNLRAVGCPDPTVQDIVRGDTERAFSFERRQLGLNDDNAGLWSRQEEKRLEAKLLGESVSTKSFAVVQNSANSTTDVRNKEQMVQDNSQPSFSSDLAIDRPADIPNANKNTIGLPTGRSQIASQPTQATPGTDGPGVENSQTIQAGADSSNPNSASMQTANLPPPQDPDPLLLSMGSRDYMIYEQKLYTAWFQNQIEGADAAGRPLTINPDNFSK